MIEERSAIAEHVNPGHQDQQKQENKESPKPDRVGSADRCEKLHRLFR